MKCFNGVLSHSIRWRWCCCRTSQPTLEPTLVFVKSFHSNGGNPIKFVFCCLSTIEIKYYCRIKTIYIRNEVVLCTIRQPARAALTHVTVKEYRRVTQKWFLRLKHIKHSSLLCTVLRSVRLLYSCRHLCDVWYFLLHVECEWIHFSSETMQEQSTTTSMRHNNRTYTIECNTFAIWHAVHTILKDWNSVWQFIAFTVVCVRLFVYSVSSPTTNSSLENVRLPYFFGTGSLCLNIDSTVPEDRVEERERTTENYCWLQYCFKFWLK